ncbi:MAG: cytochrome c [Deltaproteobacteria bacterium]|nr:MAG: cytochrome c [Deltaproteobacteria bacterium]
MRESIARAAALGSTILIVAAAAVFAWLQQAEQPGQAERPASDPHGPTEVEAPPAAAVADGLVERGMEVYEALRCASCHAIDGVGSPRSPLDGVGSRLDADEIRLWIVDPQRMRPGIRKPAYDDLARDDLEALMAYMESLRASGD